MWSCIVSSYLYAYYACFGLENNSVSDLKMTILFEIFFFVSMILKFFTTYIEEGEIVPETSHALIIQNYIIYADDITYFRNEEKIVTKGKSKAIDNI